jgi:hypothetical protein
MLDIRRRQFITLLGGVAACGARAADGEATNHRVFGNGRGFGLGSMDGRFCAATARTWLD